MSRALKQCARLRAKFLSYFTDGTLIGECILEKAVSRRAGGGVCVAGQGADHRDQHRWQSPQDRLGLRRSDLGPFRSQPLVWGSQFDGTGAMVHGGMSGFPEKLTTGRLEKGGIWLFEVLSPGAIGEGP